MPFTRLFVEVSLSRVAKVSLGTSLSILLLGVANRNAHADTLASFTAGTGTNANGYFGQPFTLSGSGSFNAITFNFLTPTTALPYAIGTGYLFTQPFLGPPAALGFGNNLPFASTTAANGQYAFDPALSLSGGKMYYFYENSLISNGSIAGAAYIPTAPSATFAYANGNFTLFTSLSGSNNFQVQGNAIAVTPEPSGLILLATGILGTATILRRRLPA